MSRIGGSVVGEKRVFVTGSTTGLGLEAAKMLVEAGHRVVLHARSEARSRAVEAAMPDASAIVIGDLSVLSETVAVADQATKHGPFDAVIHNAGIYQPGSRRQVTVDGLEQTFQVNVLAPYVLTALIPIPNRLIYLSSGMASGGTIDLDDLMRQRRRWSASDAYADSKLCDIALALAVARRYRDAVVTAVCPGWVRTRMGGSGAPTDLRTGAATQVWLATSEEPEALISGRFMRHMRNLAIPRAATDTDLQEGLLAACRTISGFGLPAPDEPSVGL
jgi:NAD(P)-dependent dehydrogenase (short-subunit alcohol dehydrogenase family)